MTRVRRTKIVGVGAGGHAAMVLDLIEQLGGYEVVGLTDAERATHGTRRLGVPVLGGDEQLELLRRAGVRCAFIGVGAVSSEGTRLRAALVDRLTGLGFRVPTLVDPHAVVSPRASIGDGTVVMAGAVVGPHSELGCYVTVYSGSIITHDIRIGDHAHLSPGVSLGGGVTIGTGAFVGMGASVIQGVEIGDWATVGAGSSVVDDVPDGERVTGVPARAFAKSRRAA